MQIDDLKLFLSPVTIVRKFECSADNGVLTGTLWQVMQLKVMQLKSSSATLFVLQQEKNEQEKAVQN